MAEYKLQGHTKFQGLPIAIENRVGSVRKGTDSDGNEWSTKMKAHYGYIKKTEGADGEEVDVFVGPKDDAEYAYVVHQHKDDGKGYDEDKVIVGVPSEAAAKKLYLAHYDSPKFLGPISKVHMDHLKTYVAKKACLDILKEAAPDMAYIQKMREAATNVMKATPKKPLIPVTPGAREKLLAAREKMLDFSKMAAKHVTDDEAVGALKQIDRLEAQKPTAGQVARYAAIGAAMGPTLRVGGNLIRHGLVPLQKLTSASGPGIGSSLRSLAADSAAGAISGGMVPLLRSELDRRATIGTLRDYVNEHAPVMHAAPSPVAPGTKMAQVLTEAMTRAAVAKSKKCMEKDSEASGITPTQPWAATEAVW